MTVALHLYTLSARFVAVFAAVLIPIHVVISASWIRVEEDQPIASVPTRIASALQAARQFDDVPLDAWFFPYVEALANDGIISGYIDGSGVNLRAFKPSALLTYAEQVKMALEASGTPLSSGTPQNRSARDDWSAPYVKTAEDLGFSVYSPERDVRTPATRGEAVKTLMEAFRLATTSNSHPFTDLPASHPHHDSLSTAYALALVTGDNGTGAVRPDDPINRAESAAIVARP